MQAADREPLHADYLAKCEQDARRFSGTWDQGTSGTLAAHVVRLLYELRRIKRELGTP
jgi:hypothetical protein